MKRKKIILIVIIVIAILIGFFAFFFIKTKSENKIINAFYNEYPNYEIVQVKKDNVNSKIDYVLASKNKKKSTNSSIAIRYNSNFYILELAGNDKHVYFEDNKPIKKINKNQIIVMLYSDLEKSLIEFKINVKITNGNINFKIATKKRDK